MASKGKGGKGISHHDDNEEDENDDTPAPASAPASGAADLPSTRSDIPDNKLSQDQLAHLMGSFSGATKDSLVDVVFSFDTTGSMSTCIELVRRKVYGIKYAYIKMY